MDAARDPDTAISIEEASEQLDMLVRRSARTKRRVVISRRRKAVAALVPIEDLAALEALEDAIDAARGQAAYAKWLKSSRKTIPWDLIKQRRGL